MTSGLPAVCASCWGASCLGAWASAETPNPLIARSKPPDKSRKLMNTRGSRNADCVRGFFFIGFFRGRYWTAFPAGHGANSVGGYPSAGLRVTNFLRFLETICSARCEWPIFRAFLSGDNASDPPLRGMRPSICLVCGSKRQNRLPRKVCLQSYLRL